MTSGGWRGSALLWTFPRYVHLGSVFLWGCVGQSYSCLYVLFWSILGEKNMKSGSSFTCIIALYHVCSGQDGAGPELRHQGRGVGQRGHSQEVHLQTCFGYITYTYKLKLIVNTVNYKCFQSALPNSNVDPR